VGQALVSHLKKLLFGSDVKRLMWLTLMVKPIGLVTQMLVAFFFGAGAQYDAYLLALFLVSFFPGALGNTFSSVVIPATIRLRRELDEHAVLGFQNAAILLLMIPAMVVLGIVALRAGWLVDMIWPNLTGDSREYLLAMVPVMALGPLAFLLVTMGKSILNLNNRFSWAGTMPVLQATVTLLVFLATYRTLGIWGLIAGYLSGMVSCFLVMLITNLRFKCVELVRPFFPSGSLQRLYQLGSLLLASQILLAINLVLDKFFAGNLEPGSVSSIMYSMSIMNLGSQLFVLSLTTVMFTRINELLAANRVNECSDYILKRLAKVGMIVVPAALGAALASNEIVRVLFQRGAFDVADTWRTSTALTLYLIGLPAIIFNSIVARIFHSLQRMRERVWLVVQYLVTNLIGNVILVNMLQVRGLAISSSVAINIHLALSFWVLSRYNTDLAIGQFVRIVGRVYLLGLLTYLLYLLSGLGGLFDSMEIRTTLFGALFVGGMRIMAVCGIFTVLYLTSGRLVRRN